MSDFIKVFTAYSYQWIVAAFFTFCGYMIKKFYKVYKKSITDKKEAMHKESQEQQMMKEGLLALLRFRVNRLATIIKDKGYMTSDESYDFQDLYKAYEMLGGNSRTHMVYEDIMKRFEIRD